MTQQRRSGRSRTSRPQKRIRYLWQVATFAPTTVAVNTILPLSAAAALDADVKSGTTLVRMLGGINVIPFDSAAVGARVNQWTAGAMVANDDLASTAITPPDPQFDNADFFWFKHGFHSHAPRSLTNQDIPGITDLIDTKSKRVLRGEEKTVLFLFKNHPTSDDALRVTISVRMLFRLS